MKNIFIILALFCSVILSQEKKEAVKPNIILIVSDDHGSGDLGCYGNDKIKTPNLDKLAEEGIRFNNAYATSASCTASRSVILSGIYNHANGLYGHMHHFHHFRAYNHIKSLPVLLEELAGYRTARIGKYHLAPEEVYKFQTVLPGELRNPVEMSKNCAEVINSDSEQPYFLYYCTSDPHRGGGMVNEHPLKPDRFGNKDEGYEGVVETKFNESDVDVPPYLPDTEASRAELAQYYQSVARMDYGIGKLLDMVKESGKWDETLIMYISDNGIAFPGAKTNVYEPGIKLPCIIKYPFSEDKNIAKDEMINWADITPTFLDVAGVLEEADDILAAEFDKNKERWDNTHNQGFQGRSFKSILDGNPLGEWNVTYASHTFHEITMYYPMRSVITDKYKLIWNIASKLPYPHAMDLWESATWQDIINNDKAEYSGKSVNGYTFRDEFELFDLSTDPNESENLAYNEDYAEILEQMKAKLKLFQEETNDPWAIKWLHE